MPFPDNIKMNDMYIKIYNHPTSPKETNNVSWA